MKRRLLLILLLICFYGCNRYSEESLKVKYPEMKKPHRCIKRYLVHIESDVPCPLCKTNTIIDFYDNANDFKSEEKAIDQLAFWQRQNLTHICPKCGIMFKAFPNKCEVISREYGAADDYNGEDVYISDWGKMRR